MKKLISLILVFCMAVMLVPALAESADIAGDNENKLFCSLSIFNIT